MSQSSAHHLFISAFEGSCAALEYAQENGQGSDFHQVVHEWIALCGGWIVQGRNWVALRICQSNF